MIILIRHACPEIDYSRCSYSKADEMLQAYNATSNIKHNEHYNFHDMIYSLIDGKNIDIRVSSSPRALATANALFPNHKDTFIIKDEYKEFDLAIFPIRYLKFNVITWLTISRIAWFIGFHGKSKSFLMELNRVNNVANEFTKKFNEKEVMLLIGHGIFNKFLSRKIIKLTNNKLITKKNNGCFSIEVYNV